jgi:hypothetical protein
MLWVLKALKITPCMQKSQVMPSFLNWTGQSDVRVLRFSSMNEHAVHSNAFYASLANTEKPTYHCHPISSASKSYYSL